MTDMKYLADALAYHTKGRSAVLEQREIQEKKCSCCDADPCNCGDDCGCKKDVNEASIVNGKNTDGEKRWKTTSMKHADAVKTHGKDNVKVTKGGLRNGDDHVQVYSEGQDLKNDKNGNGVDDKDESEAKDNVVKKTNATADKNPVDEGLKDKAVALRQKVLGKTDKEKRQDQERSVMSDFHKTMGKAADGMIKKQKNEEVSEADKSSWMKDSGWKDKDGPTKDKFGNEIKDKNRAKSLAKAAAKTSAKMTKEEVEDELLEHALDLHEMIQDLNAMFIEEDLSLTEAFQAAAMTDEELEEGIQQMSKVKQAIARKKAGRRKKLTLGYKMNQQKRK